MGLMGANPYYAGNGIAEGIDKFISNMDAGIESTDRRKKQADDLINQQLIRQQQAQQMAIQNEGLQIQRDAAARDLEGRNAIAKLYQPITETRQEAGYQLPAGQGFLATMAPELAPQADPRQVETGRMVAPEVTGRDLARTMAPYYPEKALSALMSSEGADAKMENLREMIQLKNDYQVQMSTAKNAFDTQKIQNQYDNAIALQKEKYDLLKGVKLAARGNGGNVKPPAGYRYNGDNLEAIPGGPADGKAIEKIKAAEGARLMLDTTINSLDDLMTHPGRKGATGTIKTAFIPGTDAADWAAKLDTFKAQTFLPMVQSMKGMGQLSDAEGKKLTEAVGALDRSRMSEQGIYKSMQTIMRELTLKRDLADKYTPGARPAAGRSLDTSRPVSKGGKTGYRQADGSVLDGNGRRLN